ncbi:hypothetical protein GSI_02680 [Ganoderma sinense ZZ0214-1]|uniref:Uncharacterized protein n=1 Tax=Ganoderma sinense ZZ0214-1 TaxID=1077348 RepID=A0A2G8SMD0_9APHY|nr:hypothetical protein GSI_02680 [Ganoderma sinense ZZ0214-1]
MRLTRPRSNSKPSTRGHSSHKISLRRHRNDVLVPHSFIRSCVSCRRRFVPRGPTSSIRFKERPTTPVSPTLDQAEQDAMTHDGDVDGEPGPWDSPREEPEASVEDAMAAPHDYEDSRDAEAERMAYASPPLSLIPFNFSECSPLAGVEDESSLRDDSPADSLPLPPSSIPHDHPAYPGTGAGDATDAQSPCNEVVVKQEEDEEDAMPPPAHIRMEHSLEPATPRQCDVWRRALITFPGQEAEEDRLYTTFEYAVPPGQRRPGDDIAETLSAARSGGLTDLTLYFGCPGFQCEDDHKHREWRRAVIIRIVRRLGDVLGSRLSVLQVTGPWPELIFPGVPDILGIVLDSFPALCRLHFADLQCECGVCELQYTDPARFKRLQLFALEHRISTPLRWIKSSRVTIEGKSFYSLDKDFTAYIGDDARLAGSVRNLCSTVSPNEGRAGASARAQDEAQFFVKLLKRDLPSATHFQVITPELRVEYVRDLPLCRIPSIPRARTSRSPAGTPYRHSLTPNPTSASRTRTPVYRESSSASSCTASASGYTPPPDAGVAAPVDDPPADLSGDICLQDDLSDELGLDSETGSGDLGPQSDDDFALDYDSEGLDSAGTQPQGVSDARATLGSGGAFDGPIMDADVDWHAVFMAEQDSRSDGGHDLQLGDGGIATEPPIPSLLSPIPSTWLRASTFGDEEVSVAGASSNSNFTPSDQAYHPIHFFAPGGFAWGGSDVELEVAGTDTTRIGVFGIPSALFRPENSADRVSEASRPEAADAGGLTWAQHAALTPTMHTLPDDVITELSESPAVGDLEDLQPWRYLEDSPSASIPSDESYFESGQGSGSHLNVNVGVQEVDGHGGLGPQLEGDMDMSDFDAETPVLD